MDITTLGTVVGIVAICYVIGLGCKAYEKNSGQMDSGHHGCMWRSSGRCRTLHDAGLSGRRCD